MFTREIFTREMFTRENMPYYVSEVAFNKTNYEPMRTRTKLLAAAAAAGAAAAGYYFYASKNAKNNRQVTARWAVDFKNDVVRRAKGMKDLDRAAMMGIIDSVTHAYGSVRNLDRKDLMRAANELKANWQKLSSEFKKTGATVARTAKKSYQAVRSRGPSKARSRK